MDEDKFTFHQHTGSKSDNETGHDWTIEYEGIPLFYEGKQNRSHTLKEAKELCVLLNKIGIWYEVLK